MAAEQILDAGQGPAGCRDRQLLPGDLEQQRAVQVHRRQLDHPRPRVEVRPLVDQPRQHRVGLAQVGPRLLQPHRAAGIPGHWARSRLASACAVVIPPCAGGGVRFWSSGPGRSRAPPTTAPPSIWPTVTVADATPASCGATPNVPVLIAGAITMPRPIPARISGPRTPAAYPVCGPSWASQAVAPTPDSEGSSRRVLARRWRWGMSWFLLPYGSVQARIQSQKASMLRCSPWSPEVAGPLARGDGRGCG